MSKNRLISLEEFGVKVIKPSIEQMFDAIIEDALGLYEGRRPPDPVVHKGVRVVTITKEIGCCGDCPYFGIDGGPSPVMYCNHPDTEGYEERGHIIYHPARDEGFPEKCPLWKE